MGIQVGQNPIERSFFSFDACHRFIPWCGNRNISKYLVWRAVSDDVGSRRQRARVMTPLLGSVHHFCSSLVPPSFHPPSLCVCPLDVFPISPGFSWPLRPRLHRVEKSFFFFFFHFSSVTLDPALDTIFSRCDSFLAWDCNCNRPSPREFHAAHSSSFLVHVRRVGPELDPTPNNPGPEMMRCLYIGYTLSNSLCVRRIIYWKDQRALRLPLLLSTRHTRPPSETLVWNTKS